MDKNNNQKNKNNEKNIKQNVDCEIDVRLSLKTGGMLNKVRAALVRGSLSYITC